MTLRIHHLYCGTSCPWGGRLFDGTSRGLVTGHVVCHRMLIETDAGLVLVDAGIWYARRCASAPAAVAFLSRAQQYPVATGRDCSRASPRPRLRSA